MSLFLNVAALVSLILHVVVVAGVIETDDGSPVVDTASGPVRGIPRVYRGEPVNVYYGIPYAVPPVGELRFMRPVPLQPWKEVKDATKKPSPCVQTDLAIIPGLLLDNTNSSEDCLYLNIWQPGNVCDNTTASCDLKAVIVFIHGGGLVWGDSSLFLYGGLHFASHNDVVFVGFNYRLGPFGFLNTFDNETNGAAGNMGLYDQHLALTWIKENIRSFGGDPERITLCGQSAGAVSVSYHMMSPMSKGLFKRAILQSGTPGTLASTVAFGTRGAFFNFLGLFNCYDYKRDWKSQINESLDCLRNIDSHEMLRKSHEVLGYHALVAAPLIGDEFLPSDPLSDKPNLHADEILIGENTDEGTLFYQQFLDRYPEYKLLIKDSFITLFKVVLNSHYNIPLSETIPIVNAYVPDQTGEFTVDRAREPVINAINDALFECAGSTFCDRAIKSGIDVYRYKFAHRPSYSFWEDWMGVTHADELPFVFSTLASSLPEALETYEDWIAPNVSSRLYFRNGEAEFSRQLSETWAMFAKTGKPKIPTTNEDWPKYTKENPVFVYLQPNNYTKAKGPRTDKCPLWEPYLVKRKTTTPKPGVTTPRPKPTPSKPGKRPKSRLEPEDNFLAVSAGSCPFQSATLLLILSISMYLLKPFS